MHIMPKLRLLLICLLCSFIGQSSAQAALQLFYSPTIERDFLMDGDSVATARDGVGVQMRTFVFTTSTDTSELASYRYIWNLEVFEGGTWNAVTLAGGVTSKTSESVAVALTYASGDEFPSNQ